mgnify:CR=1 FL=1
MGFRLSEKTVEDIRKRMIGNQYGRGRICGKEELVKRSESMKKKWEKIWGFMINIYGLLQ